MELTEIQRKLDYIAKGPEAYESDRKRTYKKDYLEYLCKNMRTTPHEMKQKDPEYYELLLQRAIEATDRMWEEDKKLIAKWNKQREEIIKNVCNGSMI